MSNNGIKDSWHTRRLGIVGLAALMITTMYVTQQLPQEQVQQAVQLAEIGGALIAILTGMDIRKDLSLNKMLIAKAGNPS